jgi:tape measure domain-containing protein
MAARDVEAGRAHVLLSIRDKLTQGLKLAERRLQTFGTYVATTAGTIAAGGAGALAWPLKLSADMETAAIAFEVFLGSASKAKKLIADIETMAAKTPFQFDELRDATQMLLQFGVPLEDVLSIVSDIGDISGGSSKGLEGLARAFGQATAKGRLMGQEVLQMTEANFNPLDQMARSTGRSVNDLMAAMERGEISVQMMRNAFQSATSQGGRYHGMMERQSTTLNGLISTLIDYSKIALRTFGDTLVPLFKDVMKVGISAAQGISAFVLANKELVAGVAKVILIVTAVAGAFLALGVASLGMSFVVGLIASGFGVIMSAGLLVPSVFLAIGGTVGKSAGMIKNAMLMIVSRASWMIRSLLMVPGVVRAAWSGLSALRLGALALGGAMRLLAVGTIVLRTVYSGLLAAMAAMRLSMLAAAAASIGIVRSVFSLATIQSVAYSVATGIATAATTLCSGALTALTSIMSVGLAAAPLLVVAGLIAMGAYFAYTSGVGGRAMDAIGSKIAMLRNGVSGLGTSFVASARSFVSGMIAPLVSGFKSIWNTFSTTFGAVKAAFLDGQLGTAANIAWLGVQAAAWQAAASVGESITFVLDALSSWIPGFGAVRDYVGSVIGSIGQAILSGQWELAAAIAMAKVQLAVLIPWNYIAATFSHVTTGMMIAWDYFSYAIGESFSRGADAVVDGINWLYDKFLWLQKAWANLTGDMELAVSTTKAQKDMEEYKKILQDTREGQRNARAAGLEKSVNDRSAANQNAAAARGKQETDLQDRIKALEKEVADAAAVPGSGGGTFEGNANLAKARLDLATRAAEAERLAREAQGTELGKIGAAGIKPVGGGESKIAGSFSAAAAVALGSGGNNTAQKQLTYTQRIAALMEENNRKKGAVFAP